MSKKKRTKKKAAVAVKEWRGWSPPERLEVDTGRGVLELNAYEMPTSVIGRRVDIVAYEDAVPSNTTTVDLTVLNSQELRAIAKWLSEAADWMDEEENS